MQSLLELLGVPYTGPGVAACVLCMDKVQSKHRMRAPGSRRRTGSPSAPPPSASSAPPTRSPRSSARSGCRSSSSPRRRARRSASASPGRAGDVPQALVAALSYDDRVLIERHVDGRELAVSIVDGEPLPIVEAIPEREDEFNYEARYEIGRTRYACPAELGDAEASAVRDAAVATWEALGCDGFARVDVMLDPGGESPRCSRSTRSRA